MVWGRRNGAASHASGGGPERTPRLPVESDAAAEYFAGDGIQGLVRRPGDVLHQSNRQLERAAGLLRDHALRLSYPDRRFSIAPVVHSSAS